MNKLLYRFITFMLVIMFLFVGLNCSAFADNTQSKTVSITIPSFPVEVDYMAVDSQYMQYPLIVYNDITYFPLTWNWCHRMGLVSGYTQKDGLYIAKYYREYDVDKVDNGGYQKAGNTYSATIVDYPVFINGVQIDNAKEQYPLLNFRNVTYFPLTWRFVVDEFAWYKTWDNTKGLKVTLTQDYDELEAGTYKRIRDYLINDYNDYAIVNRSIDYTVVTEDGVIKEGVHGLKSEKSLYQLDYANDNFTKIDSKDVQAKPYHSGKVPQEDVSKLFTSEQSKLLYNGKFLYDITKDAGKGNTIDASYVNKCKVNGLEIYLATVYTTQQGQQVPAPYTPKYYYVFVDKGDGKLLKMDKWSTNAICENVYDDRSGGFYLSSPRILYRNSHTEMQPACLYRISKDLKVEVLNEKWQDWKSLEVLGADKDANLYLLNTWFCQDSFDKVLNRTSSLDLNLVSPINDGIFKLTPSGELTKLYPFINVDVNSSFVTPTGQVYIDVFDEKGLFHVQTGKKIMPKQTK